MMIKESIQDEDRTSENIYAPKIGASQYMMQIYQIKNMVINSNTPMGRSNRQKMNKETQALNGTLDQMYPVDTFRTVYPNAAENNFFSSALQTFSRSHLE